MNTARKGWDLPRYTLLSDETKQEVHRSAIEILEQTGSRVFCEEALVLLKDAGAEVTDGNLVRIPAHLIEWAVRSAPPRVGIYRRDGTRAMDLGWRRTYYGTGSDCPNILDHETGEHRKFLKADVADAARLCDALPNIDFIMSMGLVSDCPVDSSDRHQFEAMLLNTTKPIVYTAHDLAGLKDIVEMASEAVGGLEVLQRKPFMILYGEPITPLKHATESMEKLLYLAERRLPMIYAPGMLRGATAPITTAGCLALANAESLTGLLIAQLKQVGAPVIMGGGAIPLDMKTAVGAYGAPELQITGMALAEMAQYYKLPRFSSAGASDSKALDLQAAIEGTISVMSQALCGANLVHDVGFLESGLCGSYAMVLAMDEAISMVRTIMGGIQLDDEQFALDTIHHVGPDGNYIAEEHTLKHFREVWYPRFLDRRNYESWIEAGGKTMTDRLNERVSDILAKHAAPSPSPEIVTRIHQIIERFEATVVAED